MSWHAEPPVLHDYAEGRLEDVRALSVEAHLVECQPCRLRLAAVSDRERLEAVWGRVAAIVEEPKQSGPEWLLRRIGVPEHVARLLAATPSLSGAWLAAVSICLAFAVVATMVGHWGSIGFLVLAPLLPVAGVAVAYGPWLDPVYEVSVAAPMSNFTLLLLRASATLASTLLLAAAAATALPGPPWQGVAWLLPSLALTVAALALGSYVSQELAGFIVGLAWIAAVALIAALADEPLAPFRIGGQAACLAVSLAAGAVLVRRRSVIDDGGLHA
jgi:hypothetical protein